MKKYKATDKHPFIEKGKEFNYSESRHRITFLDVSYDFPLPPITIDDWIEQGFIEEVQLPEFTQREMKDRCVNFLQNHSGHSLNRSIEIYDNWIKGKE